MSEGTGLVRVEMILPQGDVAELRERLGDFVTQNCVAFRVQDVENSPQPPLPGYDARWAVLLPSGNGDERIPVVTQERFTAFAVTRRDDYADGLGRHLLEEISEAAVRVPLLQPMLWGWDAQRSRSHGILVEHVQAVASLLKGGTLRTTLRGDLLGGFLEAYHRALFPRP